MVERGQVLERMTLVRSGTRELEALFQAGAAVGGGARGQGMPVVVAPSHPRHGGTMDSATLAEIVWHLALRGHPTLRFNWRGVGASTGTSSVPWPPQAPSLDDEVEDLEAAIAQHAAGRPCGVVGVSFGAAVAARVAATHALVERVVLVAPPIAHVPVDVDALLSSGVHVSVFVGSEDTVARPDEIQAALARRVGLQIIEGANHGFSRGLGELGRRVAETFPEPVPEE
jgi:hypothetical protein